MSSRISADAPTGVLLLAYGTPERLDQVEPYLTHIRGGRQPSAEAVADLRRRYEQVGGQTPLLRITQEVEAALERQLNTGRPGGYRVYTGMKHWHPYTADVMRSMRDDGIRRLIALPLAPHYSRISIGGYHKAVLAAQDELGQPFEIELVDSWHLEPGFIELMARAVRAEMAEFPLLERDRTVAVFTAHSLPVRIREWNDPYEEQLLACSEAIATRAGLPEWRFAWQSASSTGEPWLGPDIVDYLETLRTQGFKHVLQVPVGFVSDHLEILYDIDIEARGKAVELGLDFRRTALPNATPAFIQTLAAIVTAAEHRWQGAHESARTVEA